MRFTINAVLVRLIAAAALCVLSILVVDDPVARLFADSVLHHEQRRYAIGAPAILIPLVVIAILFTFASRRNRKLSAAREATMVASISALVGFVVNDLIFKPVFGRKSVDEFLYYASHYGFFPFHGNWGSSFPSGHMAIVSSVVTVLWCYFPRLRLAYVVGTAIACFLLLIGEWHFVSDIIAGAIWGNSVTLIVMKLWPRPGNQMANLNGS